jgi:hypothetical protein
MTPDDLPLLNVYEVQAEDGRTLHLVGFLDPVLAGSKGIDSRAMVGDFDPGPDGDFDAAAFRVNPEFIHAVEHYMNEQPARSPQLADEAKGLRGQWLYLVDPRNTTEGDEDPPPGDVLGAFAVDDAGQIVPGSFQYNRQHVWFDPERGVSGMLSDRRFYEWLHPEARKPAP